MGERVDRREAREFEYLVYLLYLLYHNTIDITDLYQMNTNISKIIVFTSMLGGEASGIATGRKADEYILHLLYKKYTIDTKYK